MFSRAEGLTGPFPKRYWVFQASAFWRLRSSLSELGFPETKKKQRQMTVSVVVGIIIYDDRIVIKISYYIAVVYGFSGSDQAELALVEGIVERIEGLERGVRYALEGGPPWWEFLRRSELAQAIAGSDSMAGYALSQEDAIAAVEGEQALESEANAWNAAVGYRRALAYVSQLSGDPHFQLSEGFLRSIHFMMLEGEPASNHGKWRSGPSLVRDGASREALYTGPAAEQVPTLMAEFMKDLKRKDNHPSSLVRAAMVQLNLEMIRPFSGGNSRMARCLQTLVWSQEANLDPGFCGIDEYLSRNTAEYRSVLNQVGLGSWNPATDPRPWIRFYLIARFRQATTLLGRIRETERLFNELNVEIENRGLPPRAILALAEAAMGRKVRNATYRSIADVSWNVASRDLKLLVDEGLLRPLGERRGRLYEASDFVRSIGTLTREPDPVIEDIFPNTEASNEPGMFETFSRALRARFGGTTRR